ncbi:hypothetical protein BESB_026880 [Besnoitia besnoiti]|uniref:Transmembrane protein n=1 Tax=Besnoitia besnoiti TaxID=94643 RepID=A0A2A9M3B6_BESBE|nr:uncharacterized protein BESB_026880 [Besnoitia besnoiti]PFH31714.1 hypothetical protein BESB_026880 [Besnoitia besnoiti]
MRPASLGSCLRAAAAVALCVCTGVAVVSAAAEGLRPRRLDFWNSAVQMGTQFVMYPEMEKMLEQQSLALKNILRGADTRDLKIQTYVHPESCMVVFDTIADQDNGDNMNLGLIDANSIEVVFSYGEHQGQLRYTERRQESMQFLKFATKHVQRFEVPRGCVGTANAH